MNDWQYRIAKRRRMEKKREQRLITKIQKARAMSRTQEILSLPSWNKRFRRTAMLRAVALSLVLCTVLSAQIRLQVTKDAAISALEGRPLILSDRGLDLWLKDSTAASLGHLSTAQKHEVIDQLIWSLGLPARCWVGEVPTECKLENWPAGFPRKEK